MKFKSKYLADTTVTKLVRPKVPPKNNKPERMIKQKLKKSWPYTCRPYGTKGHVRETRQFFRQASLCAVLATRFV